jgi:hypothetical protein
MTEDELAELCERWGATLRKRPGRGAKTYVYEAYKRFGDKVRVKYLIAVSKLPKTSTEAIEAKLSKLSEET